ncbi:TBC1 domain family member whacked-like [Dermatophagoides pteronyssinus]|uniref:TBC1 domain family member whacked-like n=1 Tax=Dermatophagoides pteronyssinus TaxID=6956 RepID=UPI003F681E5E
MTSIIKLDSSPSQHRKQYSNNANNNNNTYHSLNRNYYEKFDLNVHPPHHQHYVDGVSTWSNNRRNHHHRDHHHGHSYDDHGGYQKSLYSISSKQSDSYKVASPELSGKNNNHQQQRRPKSSSPLSTSNPIMETTTTLSSTTTTTTANDVDHYYPISQCLSHSESNLSNSIQLSSNNNNNRSCNKYGFFIQNDSDRNQDQDDDYETPSILDLKMLRLKERKWLQMLNNWRYYINFKWEKIRNRCRKGIPHSLRSQAWFHLCGAHLQKNRFPNLYEELLRKNVSNDILDDICKDLHRQFPNHEMFADPNGTGQTDLYNVLKAFAAYRPTMGYCQAQAPIAAVFLMHMPAERAFWCLVALSRYYIGGYFEQNLKDIRIHGQMFVTFLKKYSPSSYHLLKRQNIEPEIYMTEWFMCIYSRSLPWPSVLRVWDMFLCEGLTILFKVGLYLVDSTLKNETTKTCPTMFETCQKLRNIPKSLVTENLLINGIKRFELKDLDLLKEHKHQMKKLQKLTKKQQQQQQPK